MNYIVNKKINKASFFSLLCYVALFIFLVLQTYGFGSANIDYKQLSSQESCLYSLNQIDFYDLDEEGKSLVVTKEFITSVKNYENFKCVNKVIEINDGWPEIRIKVGDDNILFQSLKFLGFVLIFLVLITSTKFFKLISIFSFFTFNLLTNYLFSSDFKNPEFPSFYSYEFIFLETLIIYLLYLKLKDPEYFDEIIKKIISYFYPSINKYFVYLISGFVAVSNLIKFNNKGLPVIQEYLISYEFGYIRRGLLGSFFNLLSNNIFTISYLYIPLLIILVHYFYTLLVLKLYQHSNISPFDILIIFSPSLIGYQIYTISGGPANKEIFGLISLLIISIALKTKKINLYLIGSLLLNISFYIHEVNLLFIIVMLYLLKDKKYFNIISVSTFINLLFFLYRYFNTDNVEIITRKLCSEYFDKFPDMGCGKSYYLEQDFSSSINMVSSTVLSDYQYFLVYGFYFLLVILPFILNKFYKNNKFHLIFIFFNIFPLFIIAIDWGRWLFILSNLFMIIYFQNNNYLKKGPVKIYLPYLLIFGLSYLILWRLPYCCVGDLNLIYLLRVNKFNISFFIPIVSFLVIRYYEKINE